ncbi:hypothetical protein [Pseudoalteromonas sp. APC 3358]|uniref:hypothetical protein n=1 Tax=Pseudoalteromonas sp. APC 3358 TaxID=3035176 RepID=UPI0025B622AC|nr:hypothetical protein [Pseudoalteromonas sp. APC 3358]
MAEDNKSTESATGKPENDKTVEQDFWKLHNEFEKDSLRDAWRGLKVRSLFSLLSSVLFRLMVAYVVLPSTFFFTIFIMESYSSGIAETFNIVFVGNSESVTTEDTVGLVRMWHLLALMLFAISWVVRPWISPARRQANADMDRWWCFHGAKMPITKRGEQ